MEKIGNSEFIPEKINEDDTLFYLNLGGLERITVLDRLTGCGEGDIRDIETGYKDKDGKFWLASGRFDIREFPELTIEEAISKIKSNANNCIGI
jgi:hypothetical protein